MSRIYLYLLMKLACGGEKKIGERKIRQARIMKTKSCKFDSIPNIN